MFELDDPFELYLNEMKYFNNDEDDKEMFDFPILHSTPSISRQSQTSTRPIDFSSMNKHYGLITFLDRQFPIIYR